ncbi:integrase catalytic domain-containing protein [Trichonephila clavipes]|nr:integrase catalytic domain-containing protein [Trichonephila clavipes]
MFRMIEVNPSQTKLQKILWKSSKTTPTKVYELKTVTYGTASAPYLATRVLQQLALDEEKDFPLASEVLLQDFYMDDCLSGASELSEFEKLKSELTQILQRGGMTLLKWCSNKAPSTELREFSLDRSSEEVMVKTLGMLWDSSGDSFTYKVTTSTDCNYIKRDVLSQIARIYDPLGLLGPVIVKAKIFMQQLWLLKLDWNETLPPDVSTQWRNFIQTLKHIESIHVPRCFLVVTTKFAVLNGFADASSKAYGAVFYVQTNETTNQLCSKSRLAPIKSMMIPRLELCSCLLLAKLIHKVKAALKIQINSVNLYSDSTLALAWINSPSNLLKTFVSNRVSQIQQLSRNFQWQHVPSELNPADLISRGLDVKTLATSELWFFFKGPDFSILSLPSHRTEQNSSDLTDQFYINELKPVPKLTLSLNNDSVVNALLEIFSRMGFPRELQTDQSASFMNALTTEFLETFGVKVVRSSVYYPQSYSVERMHRTLNRILRIMCLEAITDWEKILPQILFALKTVIHNSTGFSPAELVHGKNLRTRFL